MNLSLRPLPPFILVTVFFTMLLPSVLAYDRQESVPNSPQLAAFNRAETEECKKTPSQKIFEFIMQNYSRSSSKIISTVLIKNCNIVEVWPPQKLCPLKWKWPSKTSLSSVFWATVSLPIFGSGKSKTIIYVMSWLSSVGCWCWLTSTTFKSNIIFQWPVSKLHHFLPTFTLLNKK